METVNVKDLDYSIFENLKTQRAPRGNPHGRKRKRYVDLVCAFDIETSTLPDIEEAIMYIWQFQIDDIVTVVGRTWEEYFF